MLHTAAQVLLLELKVMRCCIALLQQQPAWCALNTTSHSLLILHNLISKILGLVVTQRPPPRCCLALAPLRSHTDRTAHKR